MIRTRLFRFLLIATLCISALLAGHEPARAESDAFNRAELLLQIRREARDNLANGITTTSKTVLLIGFEARATELSPEAVSELAVIAQLLDEQQLSNARLMIEGHTDAVGTEAENEVISLLRATAVRTRLIEDYGVPPDMLSAKGLGETDLIEGLPRDAQEHRRVELTLEVASEAFDTEIPQQLPPGLSLFSFDGTTEVITAALADPIMGTFGQSVDFWVSAEWEDSTGFLHDPVVYLLEGPEGLRQSVHITGIRDGLTIFDNDPERFYYTRVPFDFSDGEPHHVAIGTFEGQSAIVIDGELQALIDRGTAAIAADTVKIGGEGTPLADGGVPFKGRIGGVRLWRTALLPQELGDLMNLDMPLAPQASVYEALKASITVAGTPTVNEFDPVIPVDDGAWTTFGSDKVEIHNLDDFHDGEPADLFSHHLHDHADRPLAENERTFSTYPLYLIETDLPPATLPPTVPMLGHKTGEPFDFSSTAGPMTALRVATREGRFAAISASFSDPETGEISGGALVGSRRIDRQSVITFTAEEQLKKLTGHVTDAGIVTLRVHTTRNIYGPFGRVPAGTRGVPFEMSVPAGQQVSGIKGFADGKGLNALEIVTEGLYPTGNADLPAIIVYQEDGQAARFEQVGRNRYRSVTVTNPITDARNAELVVEAPDLIRIDGIDRDLVSITAHDEPHPEAPFDDIFVVQSKAVNLPSSYMGYDITAVDPLHLVNTGTNRPVFQMPGAGSTDYHDNNRIFVPNGLMYVPEFTGRTQVTTHLITDTKEFSEAFSSTVGTSIELFGANFAYSNTHDEAHETLVDEQKEITISLARSLFYDLVLDKARMRLDPQFKARIERLVAHPDYRSFIEVFGTHYPVAVVYGGMGVMQMEFTRKELEEVESVRDENSKSIGVDNQAQAAAEKFAASGQSSESKEISNKLSNAVSNQQENFYWVGGTHAGSSKDSWSVGEDGAVPIYVELRPLSELLAPPYFTDPVIVRDTRFALRTAIDDYMKERAEGMKSGGVNVARVFDLTLTEIKLADDGDDIDRTNELMVDIVVEPGPGAVVSPTTTKPFIDKTKELLLSTRRTNLFPYLTHGDTALKTKRFIVHPDAVADGRLEVRVQSIVDLDIRDGLSGKDDPLTPQSPMVLFWRRAGGEDAAREIVANDSTGSHVIFHFSLEEVFPSDILDIELPPFSADDGS